MARLLVDTGDRLPARSVREAEHLAAHRVAPPLLEMHALTRLDLEVLLVSLVDLLLRDAEEAIVNVHELWGIACLSYPSTPEGTR